MKSTLWGLTIYFMSLFMFLANVANCLGRIMRDFLGYINETSSGFPWVIGESCSKQEGGVGIRPLHMMKL